MSNQINQCIIALTHGCNLRCNFCFAKKDGYDVNNYLDYGSLQRIIDFCSEIGVRYVVFTGGEPLLYPRLADILRYITSRPHKMIPTVATNGILLENYEFCKELLDCRLGYIDVSLKGRDPQEWFRVTGRDGLKPQLKAVNNLSVLEADFTCSMVITENNAETYCDTVENAYKSGARKFSFTFVIDNWTSGVKDLQYLRLHNPSALAGKFLAQRGRLDEITKGEWWIEFSFPLCVYTEEQLADLEGKLAAPCYIYHGNSLVFDTKLNLFPCDMFTDDALGKFGEDFSTSSEFENLKSQKKYESILHSLNHLPSEYCLSCKHKASCLGGCPWFWRHCTFEAFMEFKTGLTSSRLLTLPYRQSMAQLAASAPPTQSRTGERE